MSVDTEGSERRRPRKHRSQPLATMGAGRRGHRAQLRPSRPAISGRTWSPQAGYRFASLTACPVSIVAAERDGQLGPPLELFGLHSRQLHDRWRFARVPGADHGGPRRWPSSGADESRAVLEELVRWRAEAISRWATAVVQGRADHERAACNASCRRCRTGCRRSRQTATRWLRRRRIFIDGSRNCWSSTSWRVTKPLRAASAAWSAGPGARR